jgi:cation diffusion facilitator CzcD-associated flavoprotein CzcO
MGTTSSPAADADRAARESLRLAGPDPAGWVPPTAAVDHDVTVVGAGQSGLTIAYALRRAGITNVTVLDAAESDDVGSWVATARMLKLRTGKSISGPELGNSALSFRAWFEARRGAAAWDAVDRIATADWIDYLAWFQRQVGVPVRRGARVGHIEPAGDGTLRLHVDDTVETARKVVLATGVRGTGGPHLPDVLAGLPPERFAHTAHHIDFTSLEGRSVAVLGAAASAFDAAARALEAGAREVHLFSRRPDLVIPPAGGNVPSPAVQETFHLLPDAERWRRRWAVAAKGSSTPLDSVLRATAFADFHLHLAAPWHWVKSDDATVRVQAADGTHEFDFVIAGTGYQQDPRNRPELAGIADRIALWRDVYRPPADLRSDQLGSYPYVGPGYQLTAKLPADDGWAGNIHAFNVGASQSFGRPVGDVPSLRAGVPRLVDAIVLDLVLADLDRPPRNGTAPGSPPPSRDGYAHAIWRSPTSDLGRRSHDDHVAA